MGEQCKYCNNPATHYGVNKNDGSKTFCCTGCVPPEGLPMWRGMYAIGPRAEPKIKKKLETPTLPLGKKNNLEESDKEIYPKHTKKHTCPGCLNEIVTDVCVLCNTEKWMREKGK